MINASYMELSKLMGHCRFGLKTLIWGLNWPILTIHVKLDGFVKIKCMKVLGSLALNDEPSFDAFGSFLRYPCLMMTRCIDCRSRSVLSERERSVTPWSIWRRSDAERPAIPRNWTAQSDAVNSGEREMKVWSVERLEEPGLSSKEHVTRPKTRYPKKHIRLWSRMRKAQSQFDKNRVDWWLFQVVTSSPGTKTIPTEDSMIILSSENV